MWFHKKMQNLNKWKEHLVQIHLVVKKYGLVHNLLQLGLFQIVPNHHFQNLNKVISLFCQICILERILKDL